jgi:hypothetical protein
MNKNHTFTLRADADVGTPCPECGLKHLRAALAALLDGRVSDVTTSSWNASQALVALEEHALGYARHFDYAVGKIVLAEGELLAKGRTEEAKLLRGFRLRLTRRTRMEVVAGSLAAVGADAFLGHLLEAERESPPQVMDPSPSAYLAEVAPSGLSRADMVARTLKWIDQMEDAFPDAKEDIG